MQKAPVAVHLPSACSGVKALRNTSAARRQAAKLCYRFGPLTPSARSANLIAGDGMKNGFPAPNKELAKTQNHHLTGKAPYKFESTSLRDGVKTRSSRRDKTGKRTVRTFGHCDAWTAIHHTSVAAAAGSRSSRKSSRSCHLRKADRAPSRPRLKTDRRVFERLLPRSRRDRALPRQATG